MSRAISYCIKSESSEKRTQIGFNYTTLKCSNRRYGPYGMAISFIHLENANIRLYCVLLFPATEK